MGGQINLFTVIIVSLFLCGLFSGPTEGEVGGAPVGVLGPALRWCSGVRVCPSFVYFSNARCGCLNSCMKWET